MLNKVYPNKSTLFQVFVQTLGPNIAQPSQTIIFEHADLGRRAFLDKFSWLNRFEKAIDDYRQLMQVIGIAKSCVKKDGLNRQKHQAFKH